MTTPVRIQRRRTKGFNLQAASPNGLPVVYVGRPTRWGNPYWHIAKFHGAALSVKAFEMTAKGLWNPTLMNQFPISYYDEHREWLKRIGFHPLEIIRAELRGKNLACWCGDGPCHADVLLALVNS